MPNKGRVIASLLVLLVQGILISFLTPATTLALGEMAGRQFANSDVAYVGTDMGMRFVSGLTGWTSLLTLIILLVIWWAPLRRLFTGPGTTAGLALLIGLGLLVHAEPAAAYYEKSDYAEAYTILPNESAFWIPDNGANKDTQVTFESEEYYKQNRVPLKRFVVPHQHLTGSGTFFDYYVPAGRLLIVDRTPFSREWVDAHDRGTSAKKEGFPCQTHDGINITASVSIGASVLEQNAPKYLYRFGVSPPSGDRNDPKTIFTSVFYSRKLAEIMDDVGRKKVQTLVCSEIGSRSFDDANKDMNLIMDSVEKKAMAYFATVGITLDFIGWANTFEFDESIQRAVNSRYVAAADRTNAEALQPYAETIRTLAMAEALRASHWNGAVPQTVVGLDASVFGLMGTMFGTPQHPQAAPAAPTPPPVVPMRVTPPPAK